MDEDVVKVPKSDILNKISKNETYKLSNGWTLGKEESVDINDRCLYKRRPLKNELGEVCMIDSHFVKSYRESCVMSEDGPQFFIICSLCNDSCLDQFVNEIKNVKEFSRLRHSYYMIHIRKSDIPSTCFNNDRVVIRTTYRLQVQGVCIRPHTQGPCRIPYLGFSIVDIRDQIFEKYRIIYFLDDIPSDVIKEIALWLTKI